MNVPPLAVTMGEPSGIGLDLTLMLWQERAARNVPPFFLLADPAIVAARAERLGLSVPLAETDPDSAIAIFEKALPIVPLSAKGAIETPGSPLPESAEAVIQSIREAVDLTRAGKASAVVTNPIQKASLYAAGFSHPGHTEYLEMLANQARKAGEPTYQSVMMLAGPDLRVVPITIHIPLMQVMAHLSSEKICTTARIVARDMSARFGISNPRLAFCGLNPHAGEDGTMGREEQELITPALATLQAEGLDCRGPLPADTMFHPRARATYDVAFGMYHDQVLIPVKMIGFDDAANITLGLPFIRTSPDHGTALDLAGTGKGNPASLNVAMQMAAQFAETEQTSNQTST